MASIIISNGRPVSGSDMLLKSVQWNLQLFLQTRGEISGHFEESLLRKNMYMCTTFGNGIQPSNLPPGGMTGSKGKFMVF